MYRVTDETEGMPRIPIFLSGILIGLCMAMAIEHQLPPPPQPEIVSDVCPESMVCYEPYGAPVEAEYVLDGAMVKVKFVPAELLGDDDGYVEYQVDFERNIALCNIIVPFPEQVLGDPAMDTLGHEMLHCIVGNFHP